MATVFSRGTKLWVQFRVDGKQYKKSVGLDDTLENRKIIEKKILPNLQAQILLGEYEVKKSAFDDSITLRKFGYESLKLHEPDRTLWTNNAYLRTFEKDITSFFGDYMIKNISPLEIKRWQNQLLETRGAKRVQSIRTILGVILNDAVLEGLINENPMKNIKAPKIESVEIRPFSLEEVELLLDTNKGWFSHWIAIAAFTGLRPGEMISLQWKDINWNSKTLDVKFSRRCGVTGNTKTSASRRTIDLLDVTVKYLKDQYKITGMQDGAIFLNQYGRQYDDYQTMTDYHWKRALKNALLDHRPMYQLRHTFASLMLNNGEDLMWVSKMLGHKKAHTTLDKYSRFIHDPSKRRAKFLDTFNDKKHNTRTVKNVRGLKDVV